MKRLNKINKNTGSNILCLMIILISVNSAYAQIHSSTSAHTSYKGLSMTGYQGWFGTPGDGGTNNWRHYGRSGTFRPGTASIEYWPDMREADEDEKYLTEFVFDDGSPAYVFSSVHPKTVNRHFRWMKEYGIDGAFMQRFRSDFGIRTTMNKILDNALEAAREHNRAISLMYDIGANIHVDGVPDDAKRTEEVNKIFNDWKELIDNLGLTTGGNNQPYLYHNGKPLIVLWGVGFNHRHNTEGLDVQYWVELVDSLQNSPEYGGCSIMLGVPRSWREGGSDCISGDEHTKMLELIKSIDIIQPWHTSRYSRDQMPTSFKSVVADDIEWCKANGIDYTPTISPGIREKILDNSDYEKEREGGYYFWDMAKAAIEAGSEMLYLGMFDEVDEGTQYHKINNNPPFYRSDLSFATYDNDPEDHYLWLAGEATRALRGEFIMTGQMRTRAGTSDFLSELKISFNDAVYELQLTDLQAGRKIYYADPYKVADGAPTRLTLRDSDLFKNELAESAGFSIDQSDLYVRLVEVNETTDEVLSYKAILLSYDALPPIEIQVENYLTFDGIDDFVDCGRNESLQISGTEITIEAWFKINEVKPATHQSTILAMDHGESGNDVGYFMRANDGQVNWGFGDGSWHEVKSSENIQLFETGTWNHIAGVYDGSSQKLYLNGNLVASIALSASVGAAPAENLYLGASPYFPGRNIDGSIAEVRIWNIARTDEEIREFAAKRITGAEEGLAAYWPIDEALGQTIYDKSMHGNNGILGGTTEDTGFDPAWNGIVGIDDEDTAGSIPEKFILYQNYPNPFNPATTINYTLPFVERNSVLLNGQERFSRLHSTTPGQGESPAIAADRLYKTTLKIYDVLGRQAAILVNKQQPAGNYQVQWDASGFSSGLYFYRLTAGNYSEIKKMLLIQ